MIYFKPEEVIRCYRESKQDRCKECRLTQAVKQLPNGLDENMKALVEEVMDPAREKLGMPITCNSGFRCPVHNQAVGGVYNSQHVKAEAMDVTCKDNRQLAKVIVENGKFDQLIIYPTFVHVSYRRNGGNRKEILRKTASGYQRVDAKSI